MQDHLILARIEIRNHRQIAVPLLHHEVIGALLSLGEIAGAGHQGVVAFAAMQPDGLRLLVADQQIIAAPAVQVVAAPARGQHVITVMARQPVVAGAAEQSVLSFAALDRIVALVPPDDVVAALARQRIIARAAVDFVVARAWAIRGMERERLLELVETLKVTPKADPAEKEVAESTAAQAYVQAAPASDRQGAA